MKGKRNNKYYIRKHNSKLPAYDSKFNNINEQGYKKIKSKIILLNQKKTSHWYYVSNLDSCKHLKYINYFMTMMKVLSK